MRKLGIGTAKIDALITSPDFDARLKHPRIKERAESIDRHGLLQYPLVRKEDMVLVSGEDRVAAHVYLKRSEVEVEYVECTDNELAQIRLVENAHRRHDAEQREIDVLALVREYEKAELDALKEIPLEERVSKAKTKKRATVEARKRVAKEAKMTPAAVKQREWRAKQAEKKHETVVQRVEKEPPIDMLGLRAETQWLAGVALVAEAFAEVDGKLRTAMSALTRIQNAGQLPIPQGRLQRLQELLHDTGAIVRAQKPAMLCPFCKRAKDLTPHCAACLGHGYITQEVVDRVPQELTRQEAPVVLFNGKFVPLERFAPADAEAPSEDWVPGDEEQAELLSGGDEYDVGTAQDALPHSPESLDEQEPPTWAQDEEDW